MKYTFSLCRRKSLKSIKPREFRLRGWVRDLVGDKSSYMKTLFVRKSLKICPSPKSEEKTLRICVCSEADTAEQLNYLKNLLVLKMSEV